MMRVLADEPDFGASSYYEDLSNPVGAVACRLVLTHPCVEGMREATLQE
jgi:hypothetical protein